MLRGVRHDRSLLELKTTLERIVAERTSLQAGAAVLPSAIAATGGDYSAGINQRTNAIEVGVDAPTSALLQAFVDRYGRSVDRLLRGAGEPWACTVEDCRFTMRGGLHLRIGAGHAPGCTSGFTVQDLFGQRSVLSAGHCGNPNFSYLSPDLSAGRSNGYSFYGGVSSEAMYGPLDAELIQSNQGWGNSNSLLIDGSSYRPIYDNVLYTAIVEGTNVGYAGRWGTRRGLVTYKYFSPSYIPGGTNFVVANTCGGQGGDSGAPFFRNNTAWGILTGDGGGFGCTAFGSIDFALAAFGVGLVTTG